MTENTINHQNINVNITYHRNFAGLSFKKKEILCLFSDQTIDKAFRDLMRTKGKTIGGNYYFYLMENNQPIKLLSKDEKVSKLGIRPNAEIKVSDKIEDNINEKEVLSLNINKLENKTKKKRSLSNFENNYIIPTTARLTTQPNIEEDPEEKKKKRNILIRNILIIMLSIIILVSIIAAVVISIKNHSKKPELKKESEIFYGEEKLVANIKYEPNILFRYSNKKNITMSVEGEELDTTQMEKMNHMTQLIDFFLLIRNKNIENDNVTLIKKNWYTGYLCILNMTLNNGTHDMMLIYDEKLYKYLSDGTSNLTKLSEKDLGYLVESGKLCFVKFDFYENGNIKNIYLPQKFSENNTELIKEIIKLLIPKISSSLYQKNINDTLKKVFEDINKEDEDEDENGTYENEEENEKEDELKLRNLYTIKNVLYSQNSLRKLAGSNSDLFDNNTDFNNPDEMTIEEYLTTPSSESLKYDLREADNYENDSDLNKTNNSTNLTEYLVENIESEDAKMENSLLNTSIYTKINDNGILEFITEIKSGILNNNKYLDNEEDESNIQTYSEDYENYDYSSENITETETIDNNENIFNFSSLSLNSINYIELIDYYSNENLNEKLYEYFDSFSYKIYNENKTNEKYLRFLKNREKFMKLYNLTEADATTEYFKEPKKRKLDDNSYYYGLKGSTSQKNLYNYNLMGLKMQKKISNEVDPSTGKISSNSVMTFGNKNTKFNLKEKQTNLHIVLENKNKMAYNLINLLYESCLDLTERNKKYVDVIVQIEKNISYSLENTYDFSNLIRNSMNEMYDQVKNFTGEFFNELIQLINNVYDNYTVILDNVRNEKYDAFNKIRTATKLEYIKYINNMINILESFHNRTILFLDDIEKELNYVNNFQIDILYDITESIYDGKLIIKQFNKNLFKSIEKGILTFKYDISDYIDEIIGDLLYITDFLSVNINKNEILKQAIDIETRNEITIKLKNFRNIIITIFDLLIANINKDYDKEMQVTNENSIKFISEEKAKSFLNNIEKNSDDLINQIKLKINLYELYKDNIDNINNIQNKTFIEFINNIYNNLLINISSLQPEYSSKNSQIFKTKNMLQKISKNLTNYLNEEIREINEYVINYIEKYKEENVYNMYYNLYYFKKAFSNEEMQKLLNEFYLLLNNTFNIHFKELIDYNFYLVNQVFDEENYFFSRFSFRRRRLMGSGFIQRYYQYKSKFEKFLVLTYSEEFLTLLEKYYYKLRDDIKNYVVNEINKINKYYFNNGKNLNDFYFIEQINNEIFKIIDNIDNYYNEIDLNSQIKLKAVNYSNEILSPYHKNKINKLDKYYNGIYSRTTHYHIRDTGRDFVSSRWRFFKGWKNYYKYCPHSSNINKVVDSLTKTDEYLLNETNIIITNFIKKFDDYLNNYSTMNQKLYYNLYIYVNEKINNNKIIELFSLSYHIMYNEILNNDTNYALYKKLLPYNYNVNIFMEALENNVNLIKNNYFSIYYLNNYSDFLEYPEEIVYKINQFNRELSEITEYMRENINNIFEQKINSVINSTNSFIKDFNSFNLNYILTHINTNKIYDEYILSKFNLINQIFMNFTSQLNNKYTEYNNVGINNFFDKENYNKALDKIINNYKDFVSYFENVIYKNFTIENCTNNSYIDESTSELIGNVTNDQKCEIIIKQSELNYSKYNFNTVKLRTGIYYTKTLIENLENIFDELKYDDIINANQINEKDELLNDKNILNFYNDTLNKLQLINEECLSYIEEPYEYFIEDFKNKFSYEQDYLPFVEKFKQTITFKDEYYKNIITNPINESQNNVDFLLNDFNSTLYEQLINTNNYTYYNFNETNFQKVFKDYNNLIDTYFYLYKQNVSFIKRRYLFNISIIKVLDNLQIQKRNYYQKIVNDFGKNYYFELLNISYNLGERCNLYMKRAYDDYKFTYVYDYVELFENYTNSHIDYILSRINIFENYTKNKLENIYQNFYQNFNNNSSKFVDYKYIKDLKMNYTNCINYSYDLLNEIIKRDAINYQNYKNYTELINFIDANCSNNYTNSLSNYSEINSTINNNSKINNTNNIPYQCLLNISEIPVVEYFNETEHLLNCYDNNYYNYSVIFYEDFNELYKKKMDNLIKDITFIIKNNTKNEEELLYDYIQDYELPKYNNATVNDLTIDFEDFENMINYVNYITEDEYKDFLYNLLVTSFNKSYQDFINNYIIDEVIDNITIFINSKIEFYIMYIQNKIIDEYNYYLLILNKTNEIGITSKNSFINLYEKLKLKFNESLYYLIEDEIYFYLTMFYRENKKLFMNNFYNYYNNKVEDLSIFKFSDFFEDIVINKNLNKSLIEISSNLLNENIIEKSKNKLKILIEEKINALVNLSDIIEKDIVEILNNKTIVELNEDMDIINKIIINYTEYVNNMSNRFNFIMGNTTFNLLYEFIKDVLEPPLVLIKNKYNSIEEKLLEEIIKIINNFPNFLEIVKNNTKCDDILNNIDIYNSILNSSFVEYFYALNIDLDSYINKLIHFVYINGLNSYGKPCNNSFCMLNLNYTPIRRLDEKNEDKKEKIILTNYDKYIKKNNKINFKRKLSLNNSTTEGITKDEVITFLSYIKYAFDDFNSSYLSTDYKYTKKILKNYITKMNYTYLYKLKRSVSMVALKFKSILTDQNYQKMENKVFKQYNDIEYYINNMSDFINLYGNTIVDSLNETSILLNLLYSLTFNNTIEYYDRLNYLIQNKYKYIPENESENYDLRLIESKEEEKNNSNKESEDNKIENKDELYFYTYFENAKNEAQDVFTNFTKEKNDGNIANINKFLNKIFVVKNKKRNLEEISMSGEVSIESSFFKNIEGLVTSFYFCKNNLPYIPSITIPYPAIPYLQLRIIPEIFLGNCYSLGFELNWKNKEYSFFIDKYAKAEVSLNFEAGLYYPIDPDPVQMSITVGIQGILGLGQIGQKYSFFLTKDKFSIDGYIILKAFEFTFYIMMRIDVDVGIFSFSIKFYIYKKKLCGKEIAIHDENSSKYKNLIITEMMIEVYTIINNIKNIAIKALLKSFLY